MEQHIQDAIRRLATGESLPAEPALTEALEVLGLPYRDASGRLSMAEPIELLDAEAIGQGLSPSVRERLSRLEIFWEIGSTNTWLLERAAEADFSGRICLAERQVAGKGRRGRHWVSPFGRNIYLSIGYRMSTQQVSVEGLSLVVGMCVVGALREAGVSDIGLKWPNDVLSDGGKLCGILIEMAPSPKGEARLVIGVGVNLKLDANAASQIDQRFSTLADQITLSRNQLVSRLIGAIVSGLGEFGRTGFSPWVDTWGDFNIYEGKPVRVSLTNGEVEGIDRGVDDKGNLLLETAEGVRAFNAGEVSLRAIN